MSKMGRGFVVILCLTCQFLSLSVAFFGLAMPSSSGFGRRAYINVTSTFGDRSIEGIFGNTSRLYLTGYLNQYIDRSAAIHDDLCNGSLSSPEFYMPNPRIGPLIVLVSRGGCSFKSKVNEAELIGAAGLLLYDRADSSQLIHMHHIRRNVTTASITYSSGMQLLGLLRTASINKSLHPSLSLVTISIALKDIGKTFPIERNPEGGTEVSRNSLLFVVTSFIALLSLALAWLLFIYLQRVRGMHRGSITRRLERTARRVLDKLPARDLTEADTQTIADTCSICIETFRVGNSVRTLPCQHSFHSNCIVPWLRTRLSCPMCKLDILKHFGFSMQAVQAITYLEDEVALSDINILGEEDSGELRELDYLFGAAAASSSSSSHTARRLHQHLQQAAQSQPVMVPIDETGALLPTRRRSGSLGSDIQVVHIELPSRYQADSSSSPHPPPPSNSNTRGGGGGGGGETSNPNRIESVGVDGESCSSTGLGVAAGEDGGKRSASTPPASYRGCSSSSSSSSSHHHEPRRSFGKQRRSGSAGPSGVMPSSQFLSSNKRSATSVAAGADHAGCCRTSITCSTAQVHAPPPGV